MSRPRLLDLFCGGGGCSVGYSRAGFDVVGVDINQQPNYPFDFIQADATTYPLDGFDVIAASPPCQDHSPLRSRAGLHDTGWMLQHTLDRLADQPAPWVVENVAGASIRADLTLCGSMFGLRVYRHRKFTLDPRLGLLIAEPNHPKHVRRTSTKKRRRDFDAGLNISVTGDVESWVGPACMGIDWMNGRELSQAIPPAYTEYIGNQLIDYLEVS